MICLVVSLRRVAPNRSEQRSRSDLCEKVIRREATETEGLVLYNSLDGVVKSFQGTRGFHDFQPLTPIRLAIKRTSDQDEPTLLYNFDTGSLN